MTTRRGVLAVLGATALAGCASSPNETQSNTETAEITEEDLAIPLDGLGEYKEEVASAQHIDKTGSDATFDDVNKILEESSDVEEEREQLAEILTLDNKYSVMQAYHAQKTEGENQVVVNQNHAFYQNPGPILELYTVENNELQSGPTIKTQYGHIDKPGPQGPQSIQDLRNDDDYAQSVPQDWDGFEGYVENVVEDGENPEKGKRENRRITKKHWSSGLFGVDHNPNLVPYDDRSSNVVFDGLYHGKDTEAVVELNKAYAESDITDTDQIVSAQYTDDGWKFRVEPDHQMGDKLPAYQ